MHTCIIRTQKKRATNSSEAGSEMSKTKTNSALLLLVCAIGICFCYLYYGLILEELNKQTKDARITTFLLFTQSANNALWAAIFRVLIKYYDFVISIGTKPKLDMPQCSCSRNLEKQLNHSLLLIGTYLTLNQKFSLIAPLIIVHI